jgi:DNA-binding NtrC family response regulator
VRPNILFVSDDADLRAAVVRALGCRYSLRTARHAGHALLAGFTARIDVLVTELWMPDSTGPELACRLRRLHPHLQTIYLTKRGTRTTRTTSRT